jgi:hypothetical protein
MFRLGRMRPAHARSSGSERLLRIRSLAGYIIGTLESRFRKRQVHFAVDDAEVRFCTHLKGKASWFLPFNQGWNDGAGNRALAAAHVRQPVLLPGLRPGSRLALGDGMHEPVNVLAHLLKGD